MTKLFLAAGVAALAIAVPVSADPGKGGGGNKGNSAKAERGGGKAHAGHGQRGGGKSEARAERRGGGKQMARADRGNGRQAKAERRIERSAERGGDRRMAKIDRKDQRIVNRIENRDVVRIRDFDDDDRWANAPGLRGDCPPGLAKKMPACVPPGQAKYLGSVIPAAYRERQLPLGLRDIYRDTDDYYYRVGDGNYLYRVERRTNLVESLLPLLGAGLMTGQLFPTAYMNSYVPNQYRAFYPDSSDDYYRYANGYVYEIDRSSGLIESMIPMYAGGYGIGQMLPSSYSYYNVPYQYRSFYNDSDDYYYRYAPGAIYQVDRGTSLITAVASLLAGDLGVGSRLPLGYDVYNVPMAYRSQYYDTPDAWYRYNDGYIYQVDPTTRLITSVISALV